MIPYKPLQEQTHIATPGEQLETDYEVHQLPHSDSPSWEDSSNIIVSRALLACIEVLEAAIKNPNKRKAAFLHKRYPHDDKLVSFYTGFSSFMGFTAF